MANISQFRKNTLKKSENLLRRLEKFRDEFIKDNYLGSFLDPKFLEEIEALRTLIEFHD